MIDKINLITPIFIEVPVPRQKSERSCICVIDFFHFLITTSSEFKNLGFQSLNSTHRNQ